MFEDQARFPFAAELERNWTVIRDEMIALGEPGFIAWPEKSLYGDTGWSTFGLYAFGQKQAENCALCPRTTALVESIPGMSMAGFSRLAPGAHIKPHVGYDEYSRYVLRLHLALETNPDCALRVADETRAWQDGRTLIFCDAAEHEAWNRGTHDAHRAARRLQEPALPVPNPESRAEPGVRHVRRDRALADDELARAGEMARVETRAHGPHAAAGTASRRRTKNEGRRTNRTRTQNVPCASTFRVSQFRRSSSSFFVLRSAPVALVDPLEPRAREAEDRVEATEPHAGQARRLIGEMLHEERIFLHGLPNPPAEQPTDPGPYPPQNRPADLQKRERDDQRGRVVFGHEVVNDVILEHALAASPRVAPPVRDARARRIESKRILRMKAIAAAEADAQTGVERRRFRRAAAADSDGILRRLRDRRPPVPPPPARSRSADASSTVCSTSLKLSITSCSGARRRLKTAPAKSQPSFASTGRSCGVPRAFTQTTPLASAQS